jgi:predicted dinucleotide-binding enzyme
MQIGIIGAGKIGSTLAKLFADAGHDVGVANSRGPDTLGDLEDDRVHADTAEKVAGRSDVVVLAVPFGRFEELPDEQLAGKIVIDATNYYPDRDGHLADLDNGATTSSELIQAHLSEARVVKAFNAMRSDHLREFGHEGGANTRYGIPVSGDDADAKRQVFDLIEQIGYEPVDAGSLADGGRKHQPRTAVYTADLDARELRDRIGVEPA